MIVGACVAVFAGAGFARLHGLDDFRWLWLVAPFVLISLRQHNVATLFFILLLFFGIGWWRGSVFMDKLAVHNSLHYQKITVVGTAKEDAVYGQRYQLEFPITNVQVIAPEGTELTGQLMIRGFGEPAVYRGDLVQVTGNLYPTRGNNLGSISFAELRVLADDSFWLNRVRREFAAGMQSALPEPNASFGLGILIGQRTTLPEATDDNLRHVGLTHIIAVSGYNLTIIVLACRRLLAKHSKYQATVACLALIGLFLLITDANPPIVRASIISVLAIAAWYWGRTIKPIVLLLAAAAITIIANPVYLWGNVSWYLSFLAFFGVLVIAPLVSKRLFGSKEPGVLKSIVVESACASLLVLPYILYIFGETSLVSIPANLLVVPLIPLAMLLALIAGLAGMWLPALAGWLAWPANGLITFILDVANLLSRVPHAFVQNIHFSFAHMLGSYAVIIFVWFILWKKTNTSDKITEKNQGTDNVGTFQMVNN